MQTILQFVKSYFIFMLILFLFSYLAPKESCRKYFHFFIGVLMTAVLLQPLLQLFRQDTGKQFRQELSEIEEEISDMEYYEKGENIYEQFLTDGGMDKEETEKTE
ncbi:MAG: stage III sporulation protein AF [Lachnospiraceae bacterium]|nr:stage III sporulation protein AF [Lachnospiraceae bacterium]